jgi:uncharacterized protein (DUF2132 family)
MNDRYPIALALIKKFIFVKRLNNMQSKDPLHGKTLEMIVTELVDHFGWEDLGSLININCFKFDPSIKSSLTFLRRTPWARKKVEDLYLSILR